MPEPTNILPVIVWATLPDSEQQLYLSGAGIFDLFLQYVNPNYYLKPGTVAAFEENDLRLKLWATWRGTPVFPPYDGIPVYYPFKYTSKQTISGGLTQYYMVLRLAEQYLIRAEAYAHLGNEGGALADINVIRKRAGLKESQASGQVALLAAVAQERRVELFAEWGHRWFDLKRTGKATAILGIIPEKQPWDDRQLLYPIPPTEIRADPYLMQNPGY
jgi:SusD family.